MTPSRNRTPVQVLTAPRACHVRGGILLGHLSWVAEEHGAAARRALWEKLAAVPGWQPLEEIHAEAWIPFELLVSADAAICREMAPGRLVEGLIELGRHSARLNLSSGVHLPIGANIQSHFWSGEGHHRRFQDFGDCSYVPLNEQAFRLEYRDYPVRSRVYCISGLGYFEASVELLGGSEPIVEEASCQCYGDEACAYVVSWER